MNKSVLSKNRYPEHGFTLIEVLIVVVLVAILALVAIIGINPAKQRGKLYDVKRKRDLNHLKGIYELFYAKNQRFPTGAEVCYDNPVNNGNGSCSCHICGLEENVGTFQDILKVLYCDPEYSKKTYEYQYDCTDNPGWFKMYAQLSQVDTEGSCSYGVTNRHDSFLEPYPNECSELTGGSGGSSGGGNNGGSGGNSGGSGNGSGSNPTATPTPTPISCPADPVPKYCKLGGICNICGSNQQPNGNCFNPASCDQPPSLFSDSLCTNVCQ